MPSPELAMLGEQESPLRFRKTERYYDRELSTGGLVAIAYMFCCSSPTGNEQLVAYGGPVTFFAALLGFVVCYTIPISYMVAELSTAFPDDGGVAIWVMNAFGPFWGFQAGYWLWLSVICACVVTPDAFCYQISQSAGVVVSNSMALAFKVGVALVVAIPVFFGVRVVARLGKLLMLMVLLSFALFTGVGYAQGQAWNDLLVVRRERNATSTATGKLQFSGAVDLHLSDMLVNLFYAFDGTVLVSVFGGEVSNPSGTYSAAIFIKLVLQVVSYVLPFSSGIVYGQPEWYLWFYGTLVDMAKSMGSFMWSLLLISSDCSSIGFYLGGVFSQAYLLYGMANVNLLPRPLARRNQYFGSPNVAAFVGVLAIVLCLLVQSEGMSSLASAFSALCQLMVIVTLIRLRCLLPDAARPTKVPGNLLVLCVLMVIPICILCFMVYTVFRKPATAMVTTVLVLVGFVLGLGFQQWHELQGLSRRQFPSEAHAQEITFEQTVG